MAAVSSFVVDEDALEPVREDGDTASVRVAFDAANGCERLEQRLIRFGPGRSAERRLAGRQEVLYIIDGRGRLYVDGAMHELEPEMGAYLVPGETYAVENTGIDDLHVLSVVAPEDRAEAAGERKVTVRFEDQPELEASIERSFRYLVNEDTGCFDMTQFMGIVQPSKAPFHSHSYDEVGYVVAGEGIAHVGGNSYPLQAGSCFHLPPDEVHCIENTGSGPMHILGVFHPSGSPANRAYPDNK
jgi:mannose-6-phosphate isomerase-like protein (cupin superfamily)